MKLVIKFCAVLCFVFTSCKNDTTANKVAEIKNMLFNLIEEQMKTVMLAETRDEYVFKVIDPAIVADVKFKPKRSLIVVLGVFVGMFLAIMAIIIRRLFRNEKYI